MGILGNEHRRKLRGVFVRECIYSPRATDARVFKGICEEITNEIRAFHQELHDKFAYDLGGVMPEAAPGNWHGGLPVRRGQTLPGVFEGTANG